MNQIQADHRQPGRHPVSPGKRAQYGRHAAGHCPWPVCPKSIKANYLFCREHWYALPSDIRARILAAYRPGQSALTASPEYLEALRDALHYGGRRSFRRKNNV